MSHTSKGREFYGFAPPSIVSPFDCHLVRLNDPRERPKYCERDEMTDKEKMKCYCCPQCCTCGERDEQG